MTVKIIDHKKNPLMKREEVNAVFEHVGKPTPSRNEMLPHLEKSLKAKGELILVDKIFSVKGKGESKLKVFVYSKKEDIPKEKLELIQKRAEKKLKKEKIKEAPKEEAAAAEGEETKEETKEEKLEGKPVEESKEEEKK